MGVYLVCLICTVSSDRKTSCQLRLTFTLYTFPYINTRDNKDTINIVLDKCLLNSVWNTRNSHIVCGQLTLLPILLLFNSPPLEGAPLTD